MVPRPCPACVCDGSDDPESWLQTTVEGEGTFDFRARISSSEAGELKFYIDGQLRYGCETNEWEHKSYAISGTGTHTLRWVFRQQAESEYASGSVDYVQWDGSVPLPPGPPEPPPEAWKRLSYVYDAAGRRVEKKYNNVTVLKYIYDGDHCIAEYDGSNNLRRKYIYGPSVDEPIAMIEAGGSYAGTYYYHFDGVGSVVGLTNASGNTVEVYEYETYGRVGASDASHPNRLLFTGREYDKETGLYYYRARYYNPQIGRFLQTDPVGYGAGMNWYAYCGNSPILRVDPSGKYTYGPDWEYLVPASTRYYAAKEGDILSGGPWYIDMMLWYATGGGKTMWYGNIEANNKFVENDTAFQGTMSKALLDMAKVIYNGAYQERGPGDTGIDTVFTLAGISVDADDPSSPTKAKMNGANPGVWFDAKITWNENGFTMEGYFLWEDYMDLHPDKYYEGEGSDRYWMGWQLWWNTWIRDGLGGPSSEAYPMYMDLGFHSVTIVFDPNGNPTMAPGSWLGPSSRSIPTRNQRLEPEIGQGLRQNGHLWATGVPLWGHDGATQDPELDARQRRKWRTVEVHCASLLRYLASQQLTI